MQNTLLYNNRMRPQLGEAVNAIVASSELRLDAYDVTTFFVCFVWGGPPKADAVALFVLRVYYRVLVCSSRFRNAER